MDLCPFVEKGLKHGPPLVFLSGFPDNETSGWGEVLPEALGKKYRCIYICLPGYSKNQSPQNTKPWGFEQEEILTMMNNTLAHLGLQSSPFLLVAHDWGAFFALLYTTRFPSQVSRLVLCDVGMVDPFALPVLTIPYILFYQVFFAIAYILSQVVSFSVGNAMFWGIKAFFVYDAYARRSVSPSGERNYGAQVLPVLLLVEASADWNDVESQVPHLSPSVHGKCRFQSIASFKLSTCMYGACTHFHVAFFLRARSTARRSGACSTTSASWTGSTPPPAAPATPCPRATGSWSTSRRPR